MMKKLIYKSIVLGMLAASLSGCSLWDAERGHDDTDDVKLSDKQQKNLAESIKILEKNKIAKVDSKPIEIQKINAGDSSTSASQ